MKISSYHTLFFFLFFTFNLFAQSVSVSTNEILFNTIDEKFFGIQYHSNTYVALNKLLPLNLKQIRIWAEVADFHPKPDIWEWEYLDNKINEIITAGYEPIPCLWGEEWFLGSKDSAWWNYSEAVAEWENAAFELAERYQNKISMVIIFDELNMLKPENEYYCSFKDAAQLYIKAAKQIKNANKNILCGGPSGHLGWENGHWAEYVLKESEGKENLNFVSANIFLSWNGSDSDSLIMNRTIWYEEVPQTIKSKIGNKANPFLLLDAYNTSAVWERDGKLWTDPRNTSLFGGVYQALALLHSAKGGFDITLRWETLGGFGILNWYPQFNELPPYYSWKFIIEIAGLFNGAEIIGCNTSEIPNSDAPHHSNMNVNSYKLQPFAIKRKDGGVSIVLINKDSEKTISAKVNRPKGMDSYKIYQFNSGNIENCFTEIDSGNGDTEIIITAPALSVTVIRYDETSLDAKDKKSNSIEFSLHQNYPNPFNPSTRVRYSVHERSSIAVEIFNMLGQKIEVLVNESKSAGNYEVVWNGSHFPSGIYLINFTATDLSSMASFIQVKKALLLK